MEPKNPTTQSKNALNEKIAGADLFVNQDPKALYDFIKQFSSDKQIIEKHYSTTPLVVGVNNLSGQPQLVYMITCYIVWSTTVKGWQDYLNSKKQAETSKILKAV